MGSQLRIAALVAATAIACGGSPTAPDPTIDELRSAPLVVTIDGTGIELRASLWRDFMPFVPPGGAPLQVAVRLSSTTTTVTIDRLWVLFGAETWDVTPERSSDSWVARGGPQWMPGSRVDVVARLRSADGRSRLVRAADQPINATF